MGRHLASDREVPIPFTPRTKTALQIRSRGRIPGGRLHGSGPRGGLSRGTTNCACPRPVRDVSRGCARCIPRRGKRSPRGEDSARRGPRTGAHPHFARSPVHGIRVPTQVWTGSLLGASRRGTGKSRLRAINQVSGEDVTRALSRTSAHYLALVLATLAGRAALCVGRPRATRLERHPGAARPFGPPGTRRVSTRTPCPRDVSCLRHKVEAARPVWDTR